MNNKEKAKGTVKKSKVKFGSVVAASPAAYAKEVARCGGAEAVAKAVGIHAASVRKRMSGENPVDTEAWVAVQLVATAPRETAARPRAAQGAFPGAGRAKGARKPKSAPEASHESQ